MAAMPQEPPAEASLGGPMMRGAEYILLRLILKPGFNGLGAISRPTVLRRFSSHGGDGDWPARGTGLKYATHGTRPTSTVLA